MEAVFIILIVLGSLLVSFLLFYLRRTGDLPEFWSVYVMKGQNK